MRQLICWEPTTSKVYSRRSKAENHKEWCEEEVKRLNLEIPNYAFYRELTRPNATYCCVMIDGTKAPPMPDYFRSERIKR